LCFQPSIEVYVWPGINDHLINMMRVKNSGNNGKIYDKSS